MITSCSIGSTDSCIFLNDFQVVNDVSSVPLSHSDYTPILFSEKKTYEVESPDELEENYEALISSARLTKRSGRKERKPTHARKIKYAGKSQKYYRRDKSLKQFRQAVKEYQQYVAYMMRLEEENYENFRAYYEDMERWEQIKDKDEYELTEADISEIIKRAA